MILSSRLGYGFTQSIEAKYYVGNEYEVGAAPTGDAPTTSEWSTILLLTNVRLILKVWRYVMCTQHNYTKFLFLFENAVAHSCQFRPGLNMLIFIQQSVCFAKIYLARRAVQ